MAGRQNLPPFCLFLILFGNGYSILIRPDPLVFVENNNISVNCEAEQSESTIISLFVANVDIVTLPRYFSTSGVVGNVTYLFGPVSRSDGGLMFECRNGETASRSLSVSIPAKFVTELNSNYNGTRGENLTIGVTDEGDGTVIRTLTKDSGPVRAGVILTESGVVFTDLKCSDTGMYTLRISNGIGQGATAMFQLNVTGAAISVPDASPVSLSSSGQACVSLNKIVNVCPPDSLSTITACNTDQEGITVTATFVEGNVVMLTANPVPESGQRLNLNCRYNGGNIIVFSVIQSIYCDARCIAGIVVAVFFITLILIATIFIILCCCCCDCCKGKKKTKPERFSNKGQELS